MSARLEAWLAAAPWPQRVGLRLLLSVARRPRGRMLLSGLGPLGQLTGSLLAMGHYDDPAVSRSVGWDGRAVIARGRDLRRSEGRP